MNQESKLFSFFSRLVDLLLLNALFVITSLPVLTLGASLTALYSVSYKLIRNRESYICRDYFRAFRENFRLGSVGFLLFSAADGLLGINLWISFHNAGPIFLFIRTLSFFFLVLSGICSLYYFPVLAHFRFTWKQIWIHIPHMILTQFSAFVLLILFILPVLFMAFYSVYTFFFLLTVGILFGFAGFTYIESFVFTRIFPSYELQE